jgi:hypothetical protein
VQNSVDIIIIIKSLAGLIAILAILIFFYFFKVKTKKEQKYLKEEPSTSKQEVPQHDLQTILEIIKAKNTTEEELEKAVDLLVKYHVKIPKKLGIRSHPDFDFYEEIIMRLCRHPNTNKSIILKCDRELQKANPDYARELNNALTKGLNSRGF